MQTSKYNRIVVYVPKSVATKLKRRAQQQSTSLSSLLKSSISSRIEQEWDAPRKRIPLTDDVYVKVWISGVNTKWEKNVKEYCRARGYRSLQEFFRTVIYEDIL